jgi:hypothetical protein
MGIYSKCDYSRKYEIPEIVKLFIEKKIGRGAGSQTTPFSH